MKYHSKILISDLVDVEYTLHMFMGPVLWLVQKFLQSIEVLLGGVQLLLVGHEC